MKKIVFAGILILIILIFFGCTSNSSENETGTVTATDPDNPSAGSTHNVRIATSNYNPAEITISVGDTVSWRNEDSITHTVTSNSNTFDSGDMGSGIIFEQKFSIPGVYDYHCTYHPGMVGKVIVSIN